MNESQQHSAATQERQNELKVFVFLTVVLAPVLAVIAVGGYGLLVWIYQLFAGPPTH